MDPLSTYRNPIMNIMMDLRATDRIRNETGRPKNRSKSWISQMKWSTCMTGALPARFNTTRRSRPDCRESAWAFSFPRNASWKMGMDEWWKAETYGPAKNGAGMMGMNDYDPRCFRRRKY